VNGDHRQQKQNEMTADDQLIISAGSQSPWSFGLRTQTPEKDSGSMLFFR
jgi:hypothetical protein